MSICLIFSFFIFYYYYYYFFFFSSDFKANGYTSISISFLQMINFYNSMFAFLDKERLPNRVFPKRKEYVHREAKSFLQENTLIAKSSKNENGRVAAPDIFLRYFFGYKTEFFFFQNNPKDLDPSYKTDLDL